MSTAVRSTAPRKRARPVQAIALAGCSIVLLMTVLGLANALAGNVGWPERLQPPAVMAHLAIATAALPLTVIQLARRKGDRPHRMLGYVWCALLLSGALVSFFIHEITGGFSPPHVFAIMTVIMVPWIIYAAHTRRRKTHRNLVLTLAFTQAVAGVLTFIPDRHSLGDLLWPLFG